MFMFMGISLRIFDLPFKTKFDRNIEVYLTKAVSLIANYTSWSHRKREENNPFWMAAYATRSSIRSQQSSRLSRQLTFRVAFPKTIHLLQGWQALESTSQVRTQQMASRHPKNGGWNTLESHVVGPTETEHLFQALQ